MENQEDSFPLKLYHYISKFPEVQLKNEAEISEINRKKIKFSERYPEAAGSARAHPAGYPLPSLLQIYKPAGINLLPA
jgi:hypothetical protein